MCPIVYISWHTCIRCLSYYVYIKFSLQCQCKIQVLVINYVNEHQLPHVIDASYTTPTAHVNQGPKLLKLIG